MTPPRSSFVAALIALLAGPATSAAAEEATTAWTPFTVFNHESSMGLDRHGALANPHPKSHPSRMLTGTDGGKGARANNPKGLPAVGPFPDAFGQSVKLTADYLFVSALTETNAHSPLFGGAVYVYRRGPDGDDWVFSQKLTGVEAGEPWVPEHPEVFPFSIPGFFTIAADEDDLLIGLTATLQSLHDGVLAYRLRDATDDGVDNPVWLFDQKITRAVPADFPHQLFATRVAMDGDWLFVVSNHEKLRVPSETSEGGSSSTGVRNAGAVYVFHRSTAGKWEYVQRLTQPDGITENGMLAGPGLAVQGSHAVITGVFPVGKAYVFELRDDTRWEWTGQALMTSDSPDHPPPKGPGPAVLAAPAIDGDWLIMGAASSGSAFLYQWDPAAGRWAFRQEIAPAEPQEGAGFGSSTALGGGRAVVAAFRFDVDGDGEGSPDIPDAGAAYVFERQGGVWQEIARLQHPQPRAADVFGGSLGCVSLTATHALVGMFVNSKGFNGRPRLSGTNAGSAVVYAVPR